MTINGFRLFVLIFSKDSENRFASEYDMIIITHFVGIIYKQMNNSQKYDHELLTFPRTDL